MLVENIRKAFLFILRRYGATSIIFHKSNSPLDIEIRPHAIVAVYQFEIEVAGLFFTEEMHLK